MMALDDVKDSVPERDNTAGTTTLRVEQGIVEELKKALGVSQNKEVAPAVEASIAEYIGDSDKADSFEEKFKEQFED